MPRVQKRSLRAREVSLRILHYLQCGHDFDFLDLTLGAELPLEELRALWPTCREQVGELHAVEGRTGPTFGEWVFDLHKPENEYFEQFTDI